MNYTIPEIIRNLMETKDNLQLFHWNTKSYAKHIATDGLIVALAKNIDQFVEVYLGVNPELNINFSDIKIKLYTDKQLISTLYDVLKMLESISEGTFTIKSSLRGKGYTVKITSDIINIRDEIMANIHKTLYLLTLS